MVFTIKSEKTNRITRINLPCREKYLKLKCEDLQIPNNMDEQIKILEVDDEPKANVLFSSQSMNLDELNFLTRRLDSLTKAELDTFYAVASADKYTELRELINLSYNTNCYSLVADFSDLNALGKRLHLNEVGSENEKVYMQYDGKKYVENMLSEQTPTVTPYGLIYRNSNTPKDEYAGYTYPAFFDRKCDLTLAVTNEHEVEYLYLPCDQSEIQKMLERMGESDIENLSYSLETSELPENIANFVMYNYFGVSEINDVTTKLSELQKSDLEALSNLVEYIKIDHKMDFEKIISAVHEFEMYPDIKNHEQYGRYIICESGHFEYDENLEPYIDFERYGMEKKSYENGVFTEKAYLNYIGFNNEIAQILNKNLGLELNFEEYCETIRLYMPLEVTTYFEEDDYGNYRQIEYECEICSSELCGYEEELNEFLKDYHPEIESERGMMEYYGGKDSINAKVQSYHFEFEERDCEMHGVAVVKLNAPLDKNELKTLKEAITAQASDGLGEGLEQREFKLNGRDVYVHLWSSDRTWKIQSEDEMEFLSQNMEMNMY